MNANPTKIEMRCKKLRILLMHPFSSLSIPLRPQLAELCKHLSEKGHSIKAIVTSNKFKRYCWKKLEIYEIPSKHLLRKIILSIKIIRLNKSNIVLVRNSYVDGLIACLLRKAFQIPLVFQFTFPYLDVDFGRKGLLRGVLRKIERFLLFQVLLKADLVITLSDLMKKYLVLQGINEEKILVLPDGVNPDLFSPLRNTSEIRLKYNLGTSSVIIYVGTLHKLRRLDFLLHAFKIVKDKVKNVKLLMVGDGNGKYYLEKLSLSLNIGEDVIFVGRVPYEEVPYYIAASDVAVSPIPPDFIYKVSSPLKLFEYMSMEKPVVANEEIPEHAYVIRKSGGGLLVPYNEKKFADAIIMLLSDAELRKKMATNARQWVLQNRSYRKLAERFKRYLMCLIASPSTA